METVKEILSYIAIIIIVVLIRTFIITIVKVDGVSMYPTLNNKQLLLLKKYDKSIERFDIVVIKYQDTRLVKRVIGLPGEKIRISSTNVGENIKSNIYINDNVLDEEYGAEPIEPGRVGIAKEDIVLGDDEYFVIGDNRNNSSDSRFIGAIKKKDIVGVTTFRIFPLNKFGKIDK